MYARCTIFTECSECLEPSLVWVHKLCPASQAWSAQWTGCWWRRTGTCSGGWKKIKRGGKYVLHFRLSDLMMWRWLILGWTTTLLRLWKLQMKSHMESEKELLPSAILVLKFEQRELYHCPTWCCERIFSFLQEPSWVTRCERVISRGRWWCGAKGRSCPSTPSSPGCAGCCSSRTSSRGRSVGDIAWGGRAQGWEGAPSELECKIPSLLFW